MSEESQGPERLREAIHQALEAAAEAGRLEQSARSALESSLAALDDRLGSERTGTHFVVEKAPDSCVVTVGGSSPVAREIVAAFMEAAGARRLGSTRGWLLALGGLPPNRWARALLRVISAERRSHETAGGELPLRLTFAWSQGGELVVASVK